MSQTQGDTRSSSNSKVVTVIIKNFMFQPAMPVARPGEEIIIKNEDSVAHTFSTSTGVPAADSFSSGDIPAGGSREIKAPEHVGRYTFICLIHQFMTGTLIVKNSV
jgi:plastocyanin